MARIERGSIVSTRIGFRVAGRARGIYAHSVPNADEYIFSDFVAATAAWPRQEQPCPIAGDFCMNGGTCLFFETVGEPACR